MRYIAFALFLFSACLPDQTRAPKQRADIIYALSKDALLQHIKTPATVATVDSAYLAVPFNGDTLYNVDWSIDHENLTGALVRSRVVTYFRQVGADSLDPAHYELHDLR